MNTKILALAASSVLAATSLTAQTTNIWGGAGVDVNWSTAANWSNGVPTNGQVLRFQGTTALTNTNDLSGLVAGGLSLANSGSWNLSGNSLTLSNASGDIISGAAGLTVVVSNDIVISGTGNRQITTTATASSELRLSGNFTSTGLEIRKAGAGSTNNPDTSDLVFDGNGRTVSMGQLSTRQGGVIFANGVTATVPTNYIGTDVTSFGIDPFLTVRDPGTSLSSTDLQVGRTTNAARLNLEGGSISAPNLIIGQNAAVQAGAGFYQSGGTALFGNLRNANNGNGSVVVSGGTLTTTNNLGARLVEAGTGVFTVSGSAQVFIGTNGSQNFNVGFSGGTASIGAGELNLNGGVFATAAFNKSGTTGTVGPTTINLNGGTIRAGGNTENYLALLTNLSVFVLNGGVVFDTAGFNIGVEAPLVGSGTGGLTKDGLGRLTLKGTNTYTGNTTVNAGLLVLTNPARLHFVIGGNGTNTTLGGTGTVELLGGFTVDLSGAATNTNASWTMVGNSLSVTYGTNFFLSGFNGAGGLWTNSTNGVNYVFAQSNGILSVQSTNPVGNYDAWVGYWQTQDPGFTNTAGSADPENDGFSNDLEFAFDGNPTVGTPALVTARKSGTNTVFNFVARKDPPGGVTYEVQRTGNLTSGWTNASVTISNAADQSGINIPADYERREFVVPASGSEFYRVLGVIEP